MVALARFHDTEVRSDLQANEALRHVAIKGKPAKLQFSANKRLFNGAAGWPDLIIDQAARPRFPP